MARNFSSAIDLHQAEIRNAVAQNLAAAPGTPVEGQFYYDTVSHQLFWRSNSAWVAASGGTPTGAAGGDLAGTFPNPTIGAKKVVTAAIADGAVGSLQIADGSITATDIAAAAGILKTQLASLGIVDADIAAGAAISKAKLAALAIVDGDVAGGAAIAFTKLATPTGDVSWGSHKITNLLDPTGPQDAATKNYVDASAQGLDFKSSVRVATTVNGTLASAFANAQAVDGVTLATGDRILIKNQTTASENGIYTVNAAGAPTRATDADASGELSVGALTFVESGTVNGGQQWIMTAQSATPWVPASSGSTWTQFSGASALTAGAGLTATGNVFAVGAGAGIIVNADNITIDTAVVVRKFAQAIGDGVTTAIVVTHNLGTQDVQVVVANASSPFEEWTVETEHTSVNTVTLRFTTAPTTGQFRVTVQG